MGQLTQNESKNYLGMDGLGKATKKTFKVDPATGRSVEDTDVTWCPDGTSVRHPDKCPDIAATQTTEEPAEEPAEEPKKSNILLYAGIGVAAILFGWMIFRKK